MSRLAKRILGGTLIVICVVGSGLVGVVLDRAYLRIVAARSQTVCVIPLFKDEGYHRVDCQRVAVLAMGPMGIRIVEMTLEEAHKQGYKPCKECQPPK